MFSCKYSYFYFYNQNPRPLAGGAAAVQSRRGGESGATRTIPRGFESRHSDQNVLMKDATPKTPHESVAFSHIMRYF